MVDIYLPIEDRQILALSIPIVDIERLSLRPVKWLRFVIFTICGVRGDLATTPNGLSTMTLAPSITLTRHIILFLRVISTDSIFVAYR